ncbi:Com family DNA-binding transcriptional regulator [Pseudomonas aeruginosa]|uniref:Com family DNA-binding transcriptional regulator n=1 Tax=Pseudomonas aeruginosa TaxID=287 RepID=UPI0008FBB5E4|nr:Com family DNA-binding transcriptional regulator [Pseudomonas aeruginosa]AXS87148.1 Com family DNA-binding transcriptional regulator [Pseudomonas aeruginosa]EKW7234583.1 Com family DNA-binding transcriptional regulator [Pseudomonas aeruginosa]MBG4273502.1 Com family DNA-binding transcriptional regulator [Pseudomonas aeruginosa]MBI8829895.1 Com family DNA-binding transcriptional regulator [Pseudomonas aeruginosa]MBX5907699.1 Com family DNA-binding transcriptional regulator [Pseudomonas aerug
MKEIRCGSCSRLLARAAGAYSLQIKCPRCRTLNSLTATSCASERPRASTNRNACGSTETELLPSSTGRLGGA